MIDMKNPLEGFRGRFEQRISEPEERTMEIIESEEEKENKMKEKQTKHSDLWATIKWTNPMWGSQMEKKKKGREHITRCNG